MFCAVINFGSTDLKIKRTLIQDIKKKNKVQEILFDFEIWMENLKLELYFFIRIGKGENEGSWETCNWKTGKKGNSSNKISWTQKFILKKKKVLYESVLKFFKKNMWELWGKRAI